MLGYTPAHLELYVQAFKHKSNSVEVNGHRQHNERLEFLGDAILNSIVAEYLYKKYPNGDEGFLTKMRSKIVKRKTLDAIGARMGIDDLMTIMNKTQISRSMLGNALEALVGAVYLENGYAFTRKFIVLEILRKYLDIHRLEGWMTTSRVNSSNGVRKTTWKLTMSWYPNISLKKETGSRLL